MRYLAAFLLLVPLAAWSIGSNHGHPKGNIRGAQLGAITDEIIFCGNNDESGTVFFAPYTGRLYGDNADNSLGSTACNSGDSATEATADDPITTAGEIQPLGMYCRTNATLGEDEFITFTLRDDEADAHPDLECVLREAQTECVVSVQAEPGYDVGYVNIATGSSLAMRVVQDSDNANDDGWCQVYFTFVTDDEG